LRGSGSVVKCRASAYWSDLERSFPAKSGQSIGQRLASRTTGLEVQLPQADGHSKVRVLQSGRSSTRQALMADAEAASAAWPGARLLRVDGLGHRRLLSDPQVVAAVTGFVAESAEPVGTNGELVSIAA
jgi:hypothetical protein